jgi:hypothetical protein
MATDDLIAHHRTPHVAVDDTITEYLQNVRRALRWRRDADDIIAELQDHLYEAESRMADRGTDPRDARTLALQRLGDPAAVARSFALTPSGRLARPTRLTRAAGSIAYLASGLWVLAALLSPLGTDSIVPWTDERYMIWSSSVDLAAIATLAAVIGLLVRVGARARETGMAVVAMVMGTAAFVAGAGFWEIGATLMALGALLAVTRARAHRLGEAGLYGLVVGAPLGAASYFLNQLYAGPIDGATASFVGFALVAAVQAFALSRLGSWLRAETPADIDDYMTVA